MISQGNAPHLSLQLGVYSHECQLQKPDGPSPFRGPDAFLGECHQAQEWPVPHRGLPDLLRSLRSPIPYFRMFVYKINNCVLKLLSCRVDEDEEIIVKAMSDYWVVGKKSDQRELYVILNQKNANLIEVNGK